MTCLLSVGVRWLGCVWYPPCWCCSLIIIIVDPGSPLQRPDCYHVIDLWCRKNPTNVHQVALGLWLGLGDVIGVTGLWFWSWCFYVAKLWHHNTVISRLLCWTCTNVNYDDPGTTPTQGHETVERLAFFAVLCLNLPSGAILWGVCMCSLCHRH